MKFTLDDFIELFKELNINEDLIQQAYDMILLNDKAHNVEHCYFVARRGIRLATERNMSKHEIELVALSVLLHDIGCSIDRDEHHTLGALLTRDMLMRYNYPSEDIDIVCGAIEKHRASYKGLRQNEIEELTAIADRGPFDFEDYLKRAIQYRLYSGEVNNQIEEAQMFESVFHHMVDKFGLDGYAWKTYPALGYECYRSNIEDFKNKVMDRSLTEQTFKKILVTLNKKD